MENPKLYILAGANGSGKSTIANVLLPTEGIVCVNPDEIAKELNPENPVAGFSAILWQNWQLSPAKRS